MPVVYSLVALASLVPASLAAYRPGAGRDAWFWAAGLLAAAGPLAWVTAGLGGSWRTDLAAALWISIAASAVVFLIVAGRAREAWRLAPLLFPYLLLLGALAMLLGGRPGRALTPGAPPYWLDLHIAVAVGTYALATLAAIAGLAVFLQERALKAKRPTALTRRLPSIADGEAMLVRLLGAAEVVLGLGVATGMAVLAIETGRLLQADHKTVFSIASFLVIGALLLAHARAGIGGRRAARLVLVAYLLLTLAYPGVKFVTDVLIGQSG